MKNVFHAPGTLLLLNQLYLALDTRIYYLFDALTRVEAFICVLVRAFLLDWSKQRAWMIIPQLTSPIFIVEYTWFSLLQDI